MKFKTFRTQYNGKTVTNVNSCGISVRVYYHFHYYKALHNKAPNMSLNLHFYILRPTSTHSIWIDESKSKCGD